MKIIAKIEGGHLIEATDAEIKEVLNLVLGVAPKDCDLTLKESEY